jgi:hypothetical protein
MMRTLNRALEKHGDIEVSCENLTFWVPETTAEKETRLKKEQQTSRERMLSAVNSKARMSLRNNLISPISGVMHCVQSQIRDVARRQIEDGLQLEYWDRLDGRRRDGEPHWGSMNSAVKSHVEFPVGVCVEDRFKMVLKESLHALPRDRRERII